MIRRRHGLSRPAVSIVRQGGADLRYYVYLPDGTLLYGIEATDGRRTFYHFDEMGSTVFAKAKVGTPNSSFTRRTMSR